MVIFMERIILKVKNKTFIFDDCEYNTTNQYLYIINTQTKKTVVVVHAQFIIFKRDNEVEIWVF
jgi:hypothetical protein